MARFLSMLKNLLHHARVERDLDEEIRVSFDLLVDEKVAAGRSRDDARRAARMELGIEAVKEQVRDARAGALVEAFLWDARHALRLLGRNPIFAATAMLSLAIGIGAATAVFSVANGQLLRAAPGVRDADRLVDISYPDRAQPIGNPMASYPTYLDLRARATTLEGVYIHQANPEPMLIGTVAERQRIFAAIVSASYFDVLGVKAAAGRLFKAGDRDDAGGERIVVLSHGFWTRRFNRDAAVIGQTVALDGEQFRVVGVADERFWGTTVVAFDVWILLGAYDPFFFKSRRSEWGLIGGRLKPGVSIAQAAAELDAISVALEHEYPSDSEGRAFLVARASPIPPTLRLPLATFLALLMGLVLLVVVITCANLAGVLLARAAARRREIAVRIAIGAGPERLVRQLLTETFCLFLLGGAAALLLARWLTTLVPKLLPAFPIPVAISMPLDGFVLVFAASVTLIAGVLCGLTPALHASRADVVSGLKDDAQGLPDRLRLRHAFVVAQVAFSIVLIVAAGTLGRAMTSVLAANPGFDVNNLETARLDLSESTYTEASGRAFTRQLTERLRGMPGIEAATLADQVPMQGFTVGPMRVPGLTPADGRPFFAANWNMVGVGYFETLRLPLVGGRDFGEGDRVGTQPVAIIAQAGARQLWPGEDPIGKYIQSQPLGPDGAGAAVDLQIVGVVRDLDYGRRAQPMTVVHERGGGPSLGRPVLPAGPPIVVYVPLEQRYTPRLSLLVRSTDSTSAARVVAEAVSALDPTLPPLAMEWVGGRDARGPVQMQLRVASTVAATMGLVGVLLAAIGIYGVTAYMVTRRTREIGIRIAMGARRTDIVAMVLRQGARLVAAGAGIGLVLSAAGGRLMKGMLFGAPTIDALVFVGAAALFAAIGLVACWLPARRAVRLDPVEALRCE
jgi:predicted permease